VWRSCAAGRFAGCGSRERYQPDPQPELDAVLGSLEHRDAMVRTQRDDALACPAVTMAGLETIAVEEAGDQIMASDRRQLAHSSDDVSGGAVTLTTLALAPDRRR
jgi:hypothetical protein